MQCTHTKNMPTFLRDRLLEGRFRALWDRCVLPGRKSDPTALWREISTRYAETHRVYHDKRHLAHCLDELDLASGHVRNRDAVEMAIWFHDIINDPGNDDNEGRSAALFRHLADGVLDRRFIETVVELVLITCHCAAPDDPDKQFICDIDLASFGCPWESFLKDSEDVRAEYPGSEKEYVRGKKKFLDSLLDRPRIFVTDFFFDRYENQARSNIHRLLDIMGRSAPADLASP
ncbi:MAG: hypothetical protein H6959_01920 [Chromatiaceae bacterium]|nr:hypothetical protein [Gammaproteobacteria bacterium]MCP5300875.1 hypothetical protein [Chromatiaceae bacterium]MCP5421652.1 hypothetical protein [Chromatiaceae bacterium]